MRGLMQLFTVLLLVCLPCTAFAADWRLDVQMARESDGSLCGEMWYNNDMLWRLKIVSDGAIPVSGGSDPRVTILVPDIVNGLFVLKVHR